MLPSKYARVKITYSGLVNIYAGKSYIYENYKTKLSGIFKWNEELVETQLNDVSIYQTTVSGINSIYGQDTFDFIKEDALLSGTYLYNIPVEEINNIVVLMIDQTKNYPRVLDYFSLLPDSFTKINESCLLCTTEPVSGINILKVNNV